LYTLALLLSLLVFGLDKIIFAMEISGPTRRHKEHKGPFCHKELRVREAYLSSVIIVM